MPPAGRSLPTLWVDNSSHAADHAAAGDFQVRGVFFLIGIDGGTAG